MTQDNLPSSKPLKLCLEQYDVRNPHVLMAMYDGALFKLTRLTKLG